MTAPDHVYVVLVPSDISHEPIRFVFTDQADADTFAEQHDPAAWVVFEPVISSLDEARALVPEWFASEE